MSDQGQELETVWCARHRDVDEESALREWRVIPDEYVEAFDSDYETQRFVEVPSGVRAEELVEECASALAMCHRADWKNLGAVTKSLFRDAALYRLSAPGKFAPPNPHCNLIASATLSTASPGGFGQR